MIAEKMGVGKVIPPSRVKTIIHGKATILPVLPSKRDPGWSHKFTMRTMKRKTEFPNPHDVKVMSDGNGR